MTPSPKYYPAIFKMRSIDPSTLRIVDIWSFKSEKTNKRYIVEVEYFSHNFLGLKFYWKGVSASKDRYSILTNDFEPRTIVLSCIMIMFHYLRSEECVSFGFVAAPDMTMEDADNHKVPNKRFRFYRRMMLSLFGPDVFKQAYDINNSLYLLINRDELEKGIITISDIEEAISTLYEGDFSITMD